MLYREFTPPVLFAQGDHDDVGCAVEYAGDSTGRLFRLAWFEEMPYLGVVTVEQRAKLSRVVWIDPDRMSGAPCFAGTRVPVQMLLDHLKHGDTIDDFLEGAPSVTREQAELFLELAGEQLIECVSS